MNSCSPFNLLTNNGIGDLLPAILHHMNDESLLACDQVCNLWYTLLHQKNGFWQQLCVRRELPLMADELNYKQIFFTFRNIVIPTSIVARALGGTPDEPPVTFTHDILNFLATPDPVYAGFNKAQTFFVFHVPQSIQMSALPDGLTLGEDGDLMVNDSPDPQPNLPAAPDQKITVRLSSRNILLLTCCNEENLQTRKETFQLELQAYADSSEIDFLSGNHQIFLLRGRFQTHFRERVNIAQVSDDFLDGKEEIEGCVRVTSTTKLLFDCVRQFQGISVSASPNPEVHPLPRDRIIYSPHCFLMIDPKKLIQG